MAYLFLLFLIYFCLRMKSLHSYATKWLFLLPIQTVYHGNESLSYLGPKMWNSISTELKLESSLRTFKEPIKLWKPLLCPCRLCKTFINCLGFLHVPNSKVQKCVYYHTSCAFVIWTSLVFWALSDRIFVI